MRGKQRRGLSILFTALCIGMTSSAVQYCHDRLGDESTLTGWTLLVATAGLYLLTVRKKWIRAKLGPVAAWLQMHAYLGTYASIVFLMHIGWPIQGQFELAMAAVFVIVAGSGVMLGVLSRTTPKRLAALEQDYQLERIPVLQASVAQDAHAAALRSAALGEGATLSEYYQRRLLPFFHSQRGWVYTLFPNGILRRKLLRELGDLERYLAEQGQGCQQNLVRMVKSKDDLDFHAALQNRLRLLFAGHVALTWSLAIMVGVHVVLVYRFQGAM